MLGTELQFRPNLRNCCFLFTLGAVNAGDTGLAGAQDRGSHKLGHDRTPEAAKFLDDPTVVGAVLVSHSVFSGLLSGKTPSTSNCLRAMRSTDWRSIPPSWSHSESRRAISSSEAAN